MFDVAIVIINKESFFKYHEVIKSVICVINSIIKPFGLIIVIIILQEWFHVE